ncbi:MAG: ribose 5-phosphate isomerase B [Chloracidobacterium sp.]|uniref:Ribose 5-phosphate isomerase B n=1 Tax=Chloracidobacterium validum TaxID=2821543 RepID=A0ABX8BAC1_9BACT|nr:ribose 5-phosphate isomerase B [Chloracidobacterium validum]QUW03828.1 ribose 5-phosphate isomerase B [Chloracidobacterium validum]
MKVALGSDHAGFAGKEAAKRVLERLGVAYEDFGTQTDTESVDYPDYARAVGEAVAKQDAQCGLLFCGTGIGIGIAANKIPGIRAAVVHDVETARLAREHNDANVMAMGVRNANPDMLPEVIETFLKTAFAGGRHARRIEKIAALEASTQH